MNFKKNKFLIFFFFNILLISIIFILALPISNILKRNILDDNEYVKNQTILSPGVKDPNIIARTMQIKFVAEVDNFLKWKFLAMQENVELIFQNIKFNISIGIPDDMIYIYYTDTIT